MLINAMRNNQRFRCRPLSQCLGAISIRASVALVLAIACALSFRQCASTSSTLLGDDNYTDSTFPTKLSLDVRTGPRTGWPKTLWCLEKSVGHGRKSISLGVVFEVAVRSEAI